MNQLLHHFTRSIASEELPEQLNNPFCYTPHPLCIEAVKQVEAELERLAATATKRQTCTTIKPPTALEGKMMGVLVVETPEGEVGFLAAFSGLLMGRSVHPWFVPPLFDPTLPEGYFRREEAQISCINRHIKELQESADYHEARRALMEQRSENDKLLTAMRKQLAEAKEARQLLRQQGELTTADEARLIKESQFQKAEYKRKERSLLQQLTPLEQRVNEQEERLQQLKQERKLRSSALQQWLFEQYIVRNARGEQTTIWQLFTTPCGTAEGELKGLTCQAPPAGTGDCAAPKLLQYAYNHQLRPLALSEWWWGPSPLTEIRTPGTFYPACRGKCGPLLAFMLQGLNTSSPHETSEEKEIELLYEDDTIAVVVKPAGLCSVPGKDASLPSLYAWARRRYPQAEGPLLVHRLDMDTSGVLLLALTPEAYRHLQRQFTDRTVEKRYEALLQGELPYAHSEGIIDLPLCLDPFDRPRQMVHPLHGKPALTRYEVIARSQGLTRIAFFPLTGRTHQLRVHAAHPSGLATPILGDRLYGTPDERLYLHATHLSFTHPITGERLTFESHPPF